jgi:hypothetical protein
MRIHSDVLTARDIYAATTAAGMHGVYAETMAHGSRSHRAAFEVKLTGNSSRRPNPGTGGRYVDGDHAATWDEWGMFLAALFTVDPAAIVGTVARPTYAGREHFHAVTGNRFRTLTAPYQHGGGGHRWDWDTVNGGQLCTSCEATMARVDAAPYLAALAADVVSV